MLGPLAPFALLAVVPDGYDVVFVLSFVAAIIGLAILLLFVSNADGVPRHRPGPVSVSVRQVLGDRRLRRLTAAGMLLAVVTISDAFVYLIIHRESGMDEVVPAAVSRHRGGVPGSRCPSAPSPTAPVERGSSSSVTSR